jgi:glutamine amidotransferase
MITIIDYGVGNIKAFYNIFKKLSVDVKIAQKPSDLFESSKLILPGVGHFDYAMKCFNDSGMRTVVDELVQSKKIPVLGICVGMQMMANSSEEGNMSGLGWIDAKVKKIDSDLLTQTTRLPHMGWNDISVKRTNSLLSNLEYNSRFYFLHSYYFEPNVENDTIALSKYGKEFTCAVNHDNIYGVQFHPEKSHQSGIRLLQNFSNI